VAEALARAGRWARHVDRIERATPPGRDRALDALRAFAILGVVLGHWLGAAWELNPHLVITSPLIHQPGLGALSWIFQALAVFFFVGGHVAAGSARPPYGTWVVARLRRLLPPAVPMIVLWAVLATLLSTLGGLPYRELRAVVLPVVAPLWFLAVFALLTACTPLLLRVRPGVAAAAMVVTVAVVDLARFALGAPEQVGWVNLLAGWLVPYLLGVLSANGGLRARATAAWLLAGGVAGAVALVGWFGYPASMVGVTGERVSNLSPPSLAAVSFGIAQVGLALLLREPLAALMRRPRLWAVVAAANLSAMRIFVWHMTALVLTVLALGLYQRPDTMMWVAGRVASLPVFCLVLAGIFGSMTWCRRRFGERVRSW
jgi:fucose 4-O-acetylase-like acetyltransferase